MELRDLLAGFEPGFPQIVGNMTVIPLLSSQVSFDGIAGAENVALARDNNYSSLHLTSVEEKLTIVPSGFTYITKESAQDRTVPRVQVLEGTQEVQAFCVQSTQSGHMQSARVEDREIRLLPLAIKHYAFQAAPQTTSCGALWDRLTQYNSAMGVSGNYLVSLFNKYAEDLNAFVAQFEPIHDQRGAIVLINGRVVGIDVFPSFHGYLQIWEKLIRDSYGTEAIQSRSAWQNQPLFSLDSPASVDQVLEVVRKQKQAEKDWAYGIVTQCLNQSVEKTDVRDYRSRQAGKVSVASVKGSEVEGEVVLDESGQAIYMSLFRYAVAEKKAKAFAL